ncbi:MAG: UDP-glucose/GDP-mannose dehydrogenase family protein [Candidatus Edwardsbacteria bacterium]|jgi:UDPglucose 6-dehydrogenase|nr:UDP-glucose/GDP-mannose dehydrogenase family protein [Candidatus Edwardsbacteria bacterium]
MRIAVVGTGYVGLVTGTCFADMGNDVWCVDIDRRKIDNLRRGVVPIFEPGLEEMVRRNAGQGRLRFTTDLAEALADAQFAFIAVGTPPDEDGSADLRHVLAVARQIGRLIDRHLVIVNKSTVPVATAARVRRAVRGELVRRRKGTVPFDVVSNPEFLKEGDAINDFARPDRIVVGCDSERAAGLMRQLYEPFVRNGHPLLVMDVASAELTKYAANAMLATRISFMNELSRLCERVGADIAQVRRGIGSDSRIGMPFLYAGLGYGGSCFPKDVKALVQTSRQHGLRPLILDAVEEVNRTQRAQFIAAILSRFRGAVRGRTFAVWGLAFKPQTDDMREAPAVDIIGALRKKGARLAVHDPVAMATARAVLGDRGIDYVPDAYDALRGADALLLLTEWHQFREPDFSRMKKLLKRPVIFDGRNQYDPAQLRQLGFTYHCIGRP